MITFKQYFFEDIAAGSALGGSPGGFSPQNPSSDDFIERDDSRLPYYAFTVSRKGLIKKKKRHKRKKK